MNATSPSSEVFKDVRRYGTVLILAGIAGVIAGVLALAYPDVTLLALALIAGINLVVLGSLSLADAFGGLRVKFTSASARRFVVFAGAVAQLLGRFA